MKDCSKQANLLKSNLKKGLKRYKEYKAVGQGPSKRKKRKGIDSDSSDSNNEEEVSSSQEEFYDKLIEIEKNIAQAQKQQAFTQLEID